MTSELIKNRSRKFKALGFYFPELLISEPQNLLRDFKHSFRIVLGNCAKYVEWVNADVDSCVAKPDQGVVQEHIEPLLVEVGLLLEQQRLTAVN